MTSGIRLKAAALVLAAAAAGAPSLAVPAPVAVPALPNLETSTEARTVLAAIQDMLKRPLTLDNAVRIDLLNNPALVTKYRELDVAPRDLVKSGLLEKHERPFNLRRDFFGFPLADSSRPFPSPYHLRSEIALTAAEVVRNIGEAYLTLALMEASAPATKQLAEAEAAALELADSQRSAGTLSARGALPFRVRQAQAAMRLELQRVSTENARRQLERLLGLAAGRQPIRTAGLPLLPDTLPAWDDLESVAWANRIDARRAEEDFQRENPAGYAYSFPEVGNVLPLLAPNRMFVTPVRLSTNEIRALETRRRVATEVGEAAAQLRLAHMTAVRLRDSVLPARSAALEETLKHYNGMLVGAYDILQAKQDEVEAQKHHLEAVRNFWSAFLTLEQAVGGQLPESVAASYTTPQTASPTWTQTSQSGHGMDRRQ